jgi:hypothetical protein
MVGKMVFKTLKDPVPCWPANHNASTILEPGEIISIPAKLQRNDGRIEIIVQNQTVFCDSAIFWKSLW